MIWNQQNKEISINMHTNDMAVGMQMYVSIIFNIINFVKNFNLNFSGSILDTSYTLQYVHVPCLMSFSFPNTANVYLTEAKFLARSRNLELQFNYGLERHPPRNINRENKENFSQCHFLFVNC